MAENPAPPFQCSLSQQHIRGPRPGQAGASERKAQQPPERDTKAEFYLCSLASTPDLSAGHLACSSKRGIGIKFNNCEFMSIWHHSQYTGVPVSSGHVKIGQLPEVQRPYTATMRYCRVVSVYPTPKIYISLFKHIVFFWGGGQQCLKPHQGCTQCAPEGAMGLSDNF